MNTDNFSFSRTARLTALYLSENRRFLLLCAGTMLGASLIISLFSLLVFNYSADYYYTKHMDPAIEYMVIWYAIALFVFGCVGASMMFSDLRTRQGRIHLLMMPANSSEKFISRGIIFVILLPIIFYLCMCVGESLRCLIESVIIGDNKNTAPVTPLYAIFWHREIMAYYISETHPVLFTAMWVVGYFLVQSFFVLGSVIWPKASFLKSTVVFTGLIFFFFGVTAWCAFEWGNDKYFDERTWLQQNIIYVFFWLECAACLYNWGMAWLRLRETDVITTKR